MKNLNKLISAIILITLLCLSCCTGAKSILEVKYIVGEVVVVGNEPFTKLAVQTSPSTIVKLDCDDKTRDLLLQIQGKKVKIYYEKEEDAKDNGVVFVKKYEIISEEMH